MGRLRMVLGSVLTVDMLEAFGLLICGRYFVKIVVGFGIRILEDT